MQSDHFNSAENPYASPAAPTIKFDAPGEPADMRERQLRAFVGAKADYYLKKWNPLLTGDDGTAGWNWAAFFLTGLWLPYRKMYKAAIVLYVILIVESMAEEILFVGLLGFEETPAAVDRIGGLVAAVICGQYGNKWYLSHARAAISAVNGAGLTGEENLRQLSQRGGTSFAAAIGMFLLFIVALIVTLIPLALVLYPE